MCKVFATYEERAWATLLKRKAGSMQSLVQAVQGKARAMA